LITISFYYFVPGLQNGSILSGLYCGSLTNTPALATVVDTIKNMYPNLSGAQLDQKLSEPVIGYSVAYPFGVIGVILGFQLFKKLFSINLQEESEKIARTMGLGGEELENEDVLVSNPKIFGWLVREIFKAKDLKGLILSRIKHKNSENIEIVTGETVLEEGDILTMVAPRKILDEVTPIFGPRVDTRLHVQRDNLDYRRIVVSNPEVIGIPLGELDLHKKLQATITRVKRGDIDIIPTNETVLQAGDRIRVVASRKDLDTVGKFFGDSFQSIAHIDYISISIGIALGLLVGLIPIPMPGGTFHLGFAGGPLIVALILGKIGRTGGIVWTMSYNANLTLRQMGVVLFLAGIGLKAGYSFGKNVEAYGLVILISGMVVTFVNASLMMLIGLRVLK
ncbi:MAG: hypothetical protein KDK45_25620, partial [Leptospiraceae bacterium]|nr:hypothetical protein [Leptospiraceae bacterium]